MEINLKPKRSVGLGNYLEPCFRDLLIVLYKNLLQSSMIEFLKLEAVHSVIVDTNFQLCDFKRVLDVKSLSREKVVNWIVFGVCCMYKIQVARTDSYAKYATCLFDL